MFTTSTVPVRLREIAWTRRTLYRGVNVFREGERADKVFLLEAGLVKLSRDVGSNRMIMIRLVRPGELIGDRALSAVDPYRYSAEALADGSLWEVSREIFQNVCDNSSDVLAWVTSQVEHRLAEVERRIELISFARVEFRLLSLLNDFAALTGVATGPVQVPLSQSEIAQLIGATRETASTTLNQFERRGLVRLGRRQIEVVDPGAIREAISGGARAASAQA